MIWSRSTSGDFGKFISESLERANPQVLSAPQSSLSFVFMPILPESPFFFVDFESDRGSFEFNSLLPRA